MQRKNSATYGKFFFLRYIFTCNSFMLNVTQCITQKHQATKHRFYFSPIEQGTATHEQLMAVTVLFSSRPQRGLVLVRKYRVNMGTPAYTLLAVLLSLEFVLSFSAQSCSFISCKIRSTIITTDIITVQ